MSSETLFINRQKASWCVSKWWEARHCSLYKWVQNMIKRNGRALRKNNACAIIILTLRTVAHSSPMSCTDPVRTLCESRGRLRTGTFWGRSLEDHGVPHQQPNQNQGVYIWRQVWHKSPDLNVPLLLSAQQRRFTRSRCRESRAGRARQGQEADRQDSGSTGSPSRLWNSYLNYRQHEADTLHTRCLLFF